MQSSLRLILVGAAVGFAFACAAPKAAPELLRQEETAAPEIRNWGSLAITLDRGLYRIEIHGDGTVIYEAGDVPFFLVIPGLHKSRISRAAVRGIFQQARSADFLSDVRPSGVIAHETLRVRLAFDGYDKSAEAFNRGIRDLADAIDRATGSKRWIGGNSDTVPSLKRENWDLRSQDAIHVLLVTQIVRYGDTTTLGQLLRAGARIDRAASEASCRAILKAISLDDLDRVRLLLNLGAPVEWRRPPHAEKCWRYVPATL